MDNLTKEQFAMAYPDLYATIRQEATDEGYKAGLAKDKEEGLIQGAETERNRIRAVEEQLIGGHEDLIQTLKYDGKTSGPEAAVKVLAAEKQAGTVNLQKMRTMKPVKEEAGIETGKEKETFETLVEKYQTDHKSTRVEAIRAIAKANPDAHEEWLARVNKQR
jgi:hypothetical protein